MVTALAQVMLPTGYALFHSCRISRARHRFPAPEIARKLPRPHEFAAKAGGNPYSAARERARLGKKRNRPRPRGQEAGETRAGFKRRGLLTSQRRRLRQTRCLRSLLGAFLE